MKLFSAFQLQFPVRFLALFRHAFGITKELAYFLRKNKTIDWQKLKSVRAKMRMLIKKLLKKHKYPPEGREDAVQTVFVKQGEYF